MEGFRTGRGRRAGSNMEVANCKKVSAGADGRSPRPVSDLAGWLDSLGSFGAIRCDSRQVQPGDVFVAVRGVQCDGHDFIEQAVQRGAVAVVAERRVECPAKVVLCLVQDAAEALGHLAQIACRYPARDLTLLGVTGTNGKTTVAYLVRSILRTAGRDCGMIGTVEYDAGRDCRRPAGNTTPDALKLAELLGRMRDNRLKACVMECSSHALDQRRTAGLTFRAAAFTNLSGDHLDYHRTVESYRAAKARLFEGLDGDAVAVLNGRDPAGLFMSERTAARVRLYGLDGDYSIGAGAIRQDVAGTTFDLVIDGRSRQVRTPLIGEHNVMNCLAAAGLAQAAGAEPAAIAEGIGRLSQVPGRLERIETDRDFRVFVDYAHTDDALEHALATVRAVCRRRLWVVFGCGGQRDRSKRPRMARVAERLADEIVVTDDNPRGEPPGQIRSEIRAGLSPAAAGRVREIGDRREAIAAALDRAGDGDVVLVAGKGHEDYQLIGDRRIWFDDRQVVRDLLSP